MTTSLDMIRGRSNIVTLTNNSGGALVAGDVCIQDASADEKVTTTTSAASVLKVFIAAESIAGGATGRFYESGYCPLVNVNASVTRGRFLFTHTVAKQAAENATYGAGAFGKILKSGTTPSAIIYSATAQASIGIGGSSGSTDNAIIRADGTGGATVQSSLSTVDDSGGINIPTGQTYNINGSPHTHVGGGGNSTETANVGSEALTASGDVNFAANGPVIERYTGSVWNTWGPLFKLSKPPLAGSWTWENQSTATLDDSGGVLTLTAPAAAANYSRILKMAAPATPYTITALVGLYVPKASWYGAGLLWRQSSDGKLVYYGFQNDSAPLFSSFKVAGSANAVASVYTPVWNDTYEPLVQSASPFMWLRIQDEGATGGSNRICSFSMDGRYWITHHTVGRTDYITADEVGFGVLAENNTFGVGMTVFSWAVT